MRSALTLVGAFAFILACTHQIDRRPAHDGSTPVHSLSPLQWWAPPKSRVGSSRVSDRLQVWADLIHDKVSADLRQSPPRPWVRVFRNQESAAWVESEDVCLRVPTHVASQESPGKRSRKFLALERDGFRVSNPFDCKKLKTDARELASYFNSFNGGCKLYVEGDALVLRGEACAGKVGDEPMQASGVVLKAASNQIYFTSAFIAAHEDEDAMVASLAHELAHYYRAHVVNESLSYRYGYLYQQENRPRPGRPLKLTGVDMDERDLASNKDRIAQYTIEQEADEFAVEYVSKIGLDPFETNRKWFVQHNSSENLDQCLSRRETLANEQIPVGSLCHRLFIMDQEIKAHNWIKSDVARPEFKESWEEIRKLAGQHVGKVQQAIPRRPRQTSDVIFN